MFKKHHLALLAGLALASGCASHHRGNQSTFEGSRDGLIVTSETNKALARRLAIVNPIHRDQNGYMQIQFELENRESRQVDFAWAIDWFDQSGFHIDSNQRHWQPTSIGGYGSTTLTAIAPHPDATSWKLQITSRDEIE